MISRRLGEHTTTEIEEITMFTTIRPHGSATPRPAAPQTTAARRGIAMASFALLAVGAAACSTAEARDATTTTISYDVTENGLRFAFEPDLAFEDGSPAYGSAFVTEGYIYPDGTLADGEDGIEEDGEPTFPDLVVGTWTCHGHMTGDGMRTETGAWVVSTQIFDIDGVGTIVTDGQELADFDVAIDRAVTGGTGDHAAASGVQTQVLTGFNDVLGVTLDVDLDVTIPS